MSFKVDRARINRIAAVAPVIMSLVAFAIVLVVVTTGWERHEADEGTAAHLFQLLIALQIPAVALFLITARSRRLAAMAKPLALQLGALALAVGSLAYFRL